MITGRSSRVVVAVVLCWRGRIGLFKRSAAVGHDAGRWHCVTGYLEDGRTPLEQAMGELHEETGLGVGDLVSLTVGPTLVLGGEPGRTAATDVAEGRTGAWTVHTFRAETERRRLALNWEHDAYRWVAPPACAGYDGQVAWLRDVLVAVGEAR